MSKFTEALQNPDFQNVIRKLADGETKDVEAYGITPDIAPLMKQRLDIFASWYDQQLSSDDGGAPKPFLTNIEGIPFTAEELAQIDDAFFTEEVKRRQIEGV